ncbi:MAG: EI24 domain-containing protein [Rhodospirillaceae bacterium]|nr:EI24 domain-containing protein [Rhodospirillaceae bacterium]
MGGLISAFIKGLSQLSDPRTRSVVWASIGWTGLIFVLTWVGIWVGLKVTTFIAIGWLEAFFDFLSGAGAMVLTWFLFPPVVIAVGSLLLERVAVAVEERHYPGLPQAKGQTMAEGISASVRLLGTTLGLNILCLPLMLVPPIFPFVYYTLNGYLLSREYFEVAATRRLRLSDAKALRIKKQTSLTVIGVAYAFMLTIPLVNLITPVVATAAMVHLFHRWNKNHGSDGNSNAPELPQQQQKQLDDKQ